MIKTILSILLIGMLLFFGSCTKEKTDIADYQYMYDGMVDVWNKHATPGFERETLLGFGGYLYNSQFVLFPRETPSTLQDYYFHWTAGMDVDGYAVYFTCKPEASHYSAFVEGLENFVISNEEDTAKLLFDTEHFSLPTYLLQWKKAEQKWEVLEYIMLDEENNTVIFVYTMGELDHIEKNSSYTVKPSEMHFLKEDFSIYENFENAEFDISFLEFLK